MILLLDLCRYDILLLSYILLIYPKGILYVYNGEFKRGTKILTRLLQSEGIGLWRSVARFYLFKLTKYNSGEKDPKEKLEKIFSIPDKNDPLFEYTKSLK